MPDENYPPLVALDRKVNSLGQNRLFFKADTPPYAPFEINPESEKGQVKALQALRAKRDNALVEKTLAELHTVAKSGENIMEACIAAVKAYATVGEIVNELRKVYGKWQPTRTF